MSSLGTMLLVTTVAGAATGLGALPVFFTSQVTPRVYDSALGLAAGMMIAASVFGLIIPGMEDGTLTAVMIGVFIGGFMLLVGNRVIPHVHAHVKEWRAEGGAEGDADANTEAEAESPELATRARRALLIGGAITLHNAPEGLAIGVAFAAGIDEVAMLLAVIIGLQNVPDGFAFAVPMSETGMSSPRVLLYTTLSGLVPQVLASLFGFSLVAVATGLFPVAAGFAAGAMLAVVFREMIPSAVDHPDAATASFLVGFVVLIVVDTVVVV
ncbi:MULTISPECIES: ZIP family metal transporter [unclassified Haloparvum]|uniref:ZIP family metal transporter n=1 Tax=Haloparvum sp. PAK95 TaxID=3418962 RepID=UPI003D2F4411